MAKCPACARQVPTPFFLNVDAWRWLKCPHCGARLERKNPRYAMALTSLLLIAIMLPTVTGHRYIFLADALVAAAVVGMLVIWLRPELQVRKALPEPGVTLKIDSEPKQKHFD